MTDMGIHPHRGHSRQCFLGIPFGLFRMDPRHLPAGMTEVGMVKYENFRWALPPHAFRFCLLVISPFPFKRLKIWIPALTLCGEFGWVGAARMTPFSALRLTLHDALALYWGAWYCLQRSRRAGRSKQEVGFDE